MAVSRSSRTRAAAPPSADAASRFSRWPISRASSFAIALRGRSQSSASAGGPAGRSRLTRPGRVDPPGGPGFALVGRLDGEGLWFNCLVLVQRHGVWNLPWLKGYVAVRVRAGQSGLRSTVTPGGGAADPPRELG